jgi:predicted ArsR family transcriptional regulator
MSQHGTVTAAEVAEAIGVTTRTVRNVMARLAEKGVVELAGANRNRTYTLKASE